LTVLEYIEEAAAEIVIGNATPSTSATSDTFALGGLEERFARVDSISAAQRDVSSELSRLADAVR
jgi:hypothetical protein